jgi:hypothetical protein
MMVVTSKTLLQTSSAQSVSRSDSRQDRIARGHRSESIAILAQDKFATSIYDCADRSRCLDSRAEHSTVRI